MRYLIVNTDKIPCSCGCNVIFSFYTRGHEPAIWDLKYAETFLKSGYKLVPYDQSVHDIRIRRERDAGASRQRSVDLELGFSKIK